MDVPRVILRGPRVRACKYPESVMSFLKIKEWTYHVVRMVDLVAAPDNQRIQGFGQVRWLRSEVSEVP